MPLADREGPLCKLPRSHWRRVPTGRTGASNRERLAAYPAVRSEAPSTKDASRTKQPTLLDINAWATEGRLGRAAEHTSYMALSAMSHPRGNVSSPLAMCRYSDPRHQGESEMRPEKIFTVREKEQSKRKGHWSSRGDRGLLKSHRAEWTRRGFLEGNRGMQATSAPKRGGIGNGAPR